MNSEEQRNRLASMDLVGEHVSDMDPALVRARTDLACSYYELRDLKLLATHGGRFTSNFGNNRTDGEPLRIT
jgi:hypothetical protein